MRTIDVTKVKDAIDFLSDGKVIPAEWIANPENIALENDLGDIGIFEYAFPNKEIYSCHYYFKSRGRQAINSAKAFLDELFNTCYNIDVLMGLVPIERRDVKLTTRRLGFTSYGLEEIHGKEYELFILTKKEFNNGSPLR